MGLLLNVSFCVVPEFNPHTALVHLMFKKMIESKIGNA
jgi:hypothetical protein